MSGRSSARSAPAAAMAAVFWVLLVAFVVVDWLRAPQRNRFDEPTPFALGSGPAGGGGHCASAPVAKTR